MNKITDQENRDEKDGLEKDLILINQYQSINKKASIRP